MERGTTLLEAASLLDVELSHYCGGNCSCGTCRVEIMAGARHLSKQRTAEKMALGAAHTAAGHRLGCQTQVLGPVTVRIPDWF